MQLYNYHTHTNFSDGSSHPKAYCEEAIQQRFQILGISDHSPVGFKNKFAIRQENFHHYCEKIMEMKTLYKGRLEVLLGLEVDFIPGQTLAFEKFRKNCELDYIIGSVHLVNSGNGLWFIDGPESDVYDEGLNSFFGGNIRVAVTSYYQQIMSMVIMEKPEIVGHLDKVKMYNRDRYFSEDEPWYRNLVAKTLKTIQSTGCIVEVNTRGLYKNRSETLFPGKEILQKLYDMNIPVTVSSDAHKPHELSLLINETRQELLEMGFRECVTGKINGYRRLAS